MKTQGAPKNYLLGKKKKKPLLLCIIILPIELTIFSSLLLIEFG